MKTYRLTDEEFTALQEACKPVPYMVFGGRPPTSPRERAMAVWEQVAQRVGCSVDSIGMANTGDPQDFNANPLEPSETPTPRIET